MSRLGAVTFSLGACLLTAAALPGLAVGVLADPWQGGMFLGGALTARALRDSIRRMRFFNAFAHELSHTLVALITRGRVTQFYATDTRGGHMQHAGGARLPIVIAPYVLPIGALVLVAALLIVGLTPNRLAAAALGLACGFHVVRMLDDIAACQSRHWQGTDFAFFGPQPTLAIIVGVNALILSTLLAFALGGAAGIAHFWTGAGTHALQGLASLRALVPGLPA